MLAADRFSRLLGALELLPEERAAGMAAHDKARRALDREFYGFSLFASHTILIGSWAKGTAIRPPRDLDLLFVLPPRLDESSGARAPQADSPLGHLHDVKEVLATVARETHLRRDGRAVIADFDGVSMEVSAGFARRNGCYEICDAGQGGRYHACCPAAELAALDASDRDSAGAARDLIRLLKCWQVSRAVPLSSFAIELSATMFLDQWTHRSAGLSFYDWMVRDFLAFLLTRGGTSVPVPGLDAPMPLGSEWVRPAGLAHRHAAAACDYEAAGRSRDAWWEWEKIFGERVPFADHPGADGR